MRALLYDRYGGPDLLRIAELDCPQPGSGEVLIRVGAATVAPGDCKARAGALRPFFDVTFSKIPGRYGAGIVVALGAEVDDVGQGDRVVFGTEHTESGSAAEYIVRPREKIGRRAAGANDLEAAAVVHEGVCAVSALMRDGGIGPGSRVLIHGGAGAVGGACVQVAHHFGADVTATCREIDRAFVHSLGADRVVSFDRAPFWETVSEQDVVVDLIGGEVHARSYDVLRAGGRLVYLNADPISKRSSVSNVEVVNCRIVDSPGLFGQVADLVERGALKPRIARVLPLAEGAEAHRLVETGAVKRGRVLLSLA